MNVVSLKQTLLVSTYSKKFMTINHNAIFSINLKWLNVFQYLVSYNELGYMFNNAKVIAINHEVLGLSRKLQIYPLLRKKDDDQ